MTRDRGVSGVSDTGLDNPGGGGCVSAPIGRDTRHPHLATPQPPLSDRDTGSTAGFVRRPWPLSDFAQAIDLPPSSLPRHWRPWTNPGSSLVGLTCNECLGDLAVAADPHQLAEAGMTRPMHWPDCSFHYSTRRRLFARRWRVRSSIRRPSRDDARTLAMLGIDPTEAA
jgi:hypothetical protein